MTRIFPTRATTRRVRVIVRGMACLGAALAMVTFAAEALAAEARYKCSDGTRLTARFSPPNLADGRVALTFATGSTVTLPQVMSADGGRYASNDIEFWIKGRSATLTRNGDRTTCATN
jgi:membrane-bound inhibitor of C-type lysozyme